MNNKRIIARLDIKGPNLVKGIHLEGFRVLGSPKDFAKYYAENGADELFFQDVVASLYERNSLDSFISEIAKETFIPLTVGGGIRTLDDIQRVLRCGADKVSINTAAIKNPSFIKEASEKFGSSTIVVSIEAIKEADGTYKAYTDNGRDYTGVDVIEWAKKVEDLGAGEIVITSVDNEGTGNGFDFNLINKVVNAVTLPVTAHGGAGEVSHILEIFDNKKLHSVALASVLHYDLAQKFAKQLVQSQEGNYEFLKQNRSFKNFTTCSIQNIKETISANHIPCRIK